MSTTLLPDLEKVQETLRDERNTVRRLSEKAENDLAVIVQQVRAEAGKLLPDEVTGVVSGYCYGVNNGEKHPAGTKMPTHRFDVDLGQQVVLRIVIGSDKWDPFIAEQKDMVVDEDNSVADAVNGKRLTLRRDAAYGRYVPVRFADVPLGVDRNGTEVFGGSQVYIVNEDIQGTLKKFNEESGYYKIAREDGLFGGGSYDEEYGGELFNASRSSIELVGA